MKGTSVRTKTIKFMSFGADGVSTIQGKMGLAKTTEIETPEKLRDYILRVDGGLHAPRPGTCGVYFVTGQFGHENMAVLIDRRGSTGGATIQSLSSKVVPDAPCIERAGCGGDA